MIGSGLIMIIRDSARKGKSAYAIGKEQNISKNTAKKYMQVGTVNVNQKVSHLLTNF